MCEVLAGYGIPAEKIAQVLKITAVTLRKHFHEELERGGSVVEAKLVGNLLRLAGGNDGTALKAIMFSLQTRFSWSAYAPRPLEIGKKEQANIEAQTAHEADDEWSQLLN